MIRWLQPRMATGKAATVPDLSQSSPMSGNVCVRMSFYASVDYVMEIVL